MLVEGQGGHRFRHMRTVVVLEPTPNGGELPCRACSSCCSWLSSVGCISLAEDRYLLPKHAPRVAGTFGLRRSRVPCTGWKTPGPLCRFSAPLNTGIRRPGVYVPHRQVNTPDVLESVCAVGARLLRLPRGRAHSHLPLDISGRLLSEPLVRLGGLR